MLLFSRIVTLGGSPRRSVPWAAEVTAYVNAHSTLDVACWSGTFGYPIGTMAWSTVVESQAALAAATAPLLADGGYLDLLESAADLVTTPGEDLLRELVHGTPSDPPPIGAVATITTATAVVDRMGEALGWAVDIAQYGEGVIGAPIAVFTDVFGPMGGITWISVHPDVAASDDARAKLRADPGYLERLVGTKGVYIPGSGHVSLVTRIA
jgi:hypothetical protein